MRKNIVFGLGARKRLRAADSRQSRAQDLLGEDAFPSLLHREGILLGGRGLSNLARRLLGRLDLLPMIFSPTVILTFGKFLVNFERPVLGCIEAEFCK